MSRRVPPLEAVRYFERAAEFESLARAAEDCGVTKGAVSQQIKKLEQYLGATLFERAGRRVRLTDTGRRYHTAVRRVFSQLEDATEKARGPRHRPTLRLTVLPAIASMWLVPRLAAFQADFPQIDIRVSAEAAMVDFARSDMHVGIRYGRGPGDGLRIIALARDELTPVCAPAFLARQKIERPEDLAGCRLLHDTYWSGDWHRWAAGAGVELPSVHEGQYFTHYSMAIDSARLGNGVAMGHRLLLREALRRGELVAPLAHRETAEAAYYVVHPRDVGHLHYVKVFTDWVTAAFAAPDRD